MTLKAFKQVVARAQNRCEQMNISPETMRKNLYLYLYLYLKLEVDSQPELFALFIEWLRKH